jgi:hypothetical protein
MLDIMANPLEKSDFIIILMDTSGLLEDGM